MSFLQPIIIPRGYIATTSNKTIPRKRLNSISEISLKPSLPKLPRVYVKRANIDPFEQHYVTPFIRMFDEEEEEKQSILDEQKSKLKQIAEAAASSELGRRIVYAARETFGGNPIKFYYDLITMPADVIHLLEPIINTGNDTGEAIKLLQSEEEEEEEEEEESVIDQDEKNKEISETIGDIRNFVRRTGGLPRWGIRKLQKLKKKFFGDDDDIDVSDFLQTSNKEETERLQQGLLISKYQQKGYKERMEATKSLQSLLKSQEVQKEQERQQEAVEELQNLLHGNKRPSPSYDDNDDLFEHSPVLKKSRSDPIQVERYVQAQNKRDIQEFFKQNPEPEEIPEEIHEKLTIFLNNKRKRNIIDPLIEYKDSRDSFNDGYYQYNPKTRELIVIPGYRDASILPKPKQGFRYL